MKKQFPMQKVLEFREKELDREQAKLRELINQEKMMLLQMSEIVEEIKAKRLEQENDVALGKFEFTDLYNKYIASREKDLDYIKLNHNKLLKSIEAQKEVMKKALSNVKIMEKLKEKHLLNYAKYLAKQEEMQIDEINITKANTKDNSF